MLHLALAVVEYHRVPILLIAGTALLRVVVLRAVELVDALVEVFHIVGVYEVHNHGYAELMGAVYERAQLIGSTETRRGGKETRHVVAKRAVVGVLGYGHELHGVISRLLDAWQDVVAELGVCTHTLTLLGHAHVSLVDEQLADLRCAEVVVLPVVGSLDDKLCGIVLRRLVLHHTLGVCRYAVAPAVVAVNVYLVQGAIR